MATYQVLENNGPYLLVKVMFGEQTFYQWLITNNTGYELAVQLQEYADIYEANWLP